MAQETLFITTTPGLEPALALECERLGFAPREEAGGVTVEGAAGSYVRMNVWLRTASRVLLRVAEVSARDPRALESGLRKLELSRWFRPGTKLEPSASVHHNRLRASEVERIASRVFGGRPDARPSGGEDPAAGANLLLRVEDDLCTVSVDTSGELLHRRGYRQEISHAPLRETLAAGLLLLSGYDGKSPFWDPMCGSGTIAIEAALMAANRAPGADRSFAFEAFPEFRKDWLEAAKRGVVDQPLPPIRATDLHSGALGSARRNARRAGFEGKLQLERLDVTKISPPQGSAKGFLISNPPYGKRVGEKGDLASLYRGIGEAFRRFHGWHFGLLVADKALTAALKLPISRAHRLQNGGIWCELVTGTIP